MLHQGQLALGDGPMLARWTPLVCVGISYFLIAVVYPLFTIHTESQGNWSPSGAFWSFLAGSIGAVGALGIILAFMFGGTPIFVMPMVFGFAPVINTMVTMLMFRTIRKAPLVFYLGVLVVAIGAAGVMYFQPKPPETTASIALVQPTNESNDSGLVRLAATKATAENQPTKEGHGGEVFDNASAEHFWWMLGSVALTAFCWGAYGPVLHRGQMKMGGSRLRPFLFVGLAYFAFAVAMPLVLQNVLPADPGEFGLTGVVWSLIAGAAGAIGALGIIYAFDFGGKPILVMPLVFGGAPVINTMASSIADRSLGELSPLFYISLFLVIAGAVTVLTTAPRHSPKLKPEIT